MDGMIATPPETVNPIINSGLGIPRRDKNITLRHRHVHDLKTTIAT